MQSDKDGQGLSQAAKRMSNGAECVGNGTECVSNATECAGSDADWVGHEADWVGSDAEWVGQEAEWVGNGAERVALLDPPSMPGPLHLRLPVIPDDPDLAAELPDPPRRRLSALRTLFAIAILCAAGGGIYLATRSSPRRVAPKLAASSFAPYVDVTLTPTYAFQDPTADPVRNVTLGFVVSSPSAPCTPTWGTYYTLAQAESALNLDQRIGQVIAQGGIPTVSFGGAANSELAVGCVSSSALANAYASVLHRYHVASADFDIEGAALGDAAANARRAAAVAALQQRARTASTPLAVWLTLPVTPSGFQAGALNAIHSMLADGVALTGVNLLAMDFPAGTVHGGKMLAAVQAALYAAHSQVEALERQQQLRWSAAGVWNHLGVTVMIGQNDVLGEEFTLAAARRLLAFVAAHRMSRISIWSLNRDVQCGSVFPEYGVHSNTCSGVAQTPLEFTRIFSGLPGTVTAAAINTSPVSPTLKAMTDNPATSPYPIWQPNAMYQAGYRVVWHRDVYEAKWFTQGAPPDAYSRSAASAPWLLIGPVLGGERFPVPPSYAASYPVWSARTVYHAGAHVRYQGYPYVARYYSKGQQPQLLLPPNPGSPWKPLLVVPGEPAGQ